MTKNQKSIWDRMQEIDDKILYIALFLSLLLPLLIPIGIPSPMMPETIQAFNVVSSLANLPVEKTYQVIFFQWDAHPVNYAEQGTGGKSLMYHAFRLPVKIVFFTLKAEGLTLFDSAIEICLPKDGSRIYGRDYVYLGFRTGGIAAGNLITEDFRAFASTDYKGTPLSQIPGLNWLTDIRGAKDCPMMLGLNYMETGGYMTETLKVNYPKVLIVTSGQQNQFPAAKSNIAAGLLNGIVSGIRGSAEYDKLLGRKTSTIAQMDSQSTSAILTLGLIILTNIGYWGGKMSKRAKTEIPAASR